MWGIILAYFVTGILVIWWDYRRPMFDRPSYVRDGMVGLMALNVIGWLPLKSIAAFQHGLWGDLSKTLAAFAVLCLAMQFVVPTP